jgi:predicted Zn-dependent protease
MRIKPEAKDWDWEIHVTSDPNVDAFCMAGGKILVGSTFVHDLDLDDGELATLLGHEIAHALAEHHREELSEARHIVPQSAMSLDVMMERLHTDPSMQRRLAFLSNLQESEADQLGMVLVRQSGWPASAMVGFYQKLAMMDAPSVMASSHPTVASRVSMAKGMALLLAD